MSSRIVPAALLFLTAACSAGAPATVEAPDMSGLEADLRAIIGPASGEIGVALIDLESGERLGIDEEVSMHAASTMKVPVLMELFRQADEGRFSVDDSITVLDEFTSIVDGSTYSLGGDRDQELVDRLGGTMSLRRLGLGMTIYSSNLATNILIDHLGAEEVQQLMAESGAEGMVVLRGVEDGPAFEAGLNNTATAAALARSLEVIATCVIHPTEPPQGMPEILEAQECRSEIPAGVPDGVRVGNKTGSITGIRHDGAIVMPPGREPYILTILTRDFDTPENATQVMVEISRRVWEELGTPAATLSVSQHPNPHLRSADDFKT